MSDAVPSGTGGDAEQAARDTLAGAVGRLPEPALTAARDGYVNGLQVAALTGALLLAATAAAATWALRRKASADHLDHMSSTDTHETKGG